MGLHRFRFIAADGVEHQLEDSRALIEAIRSGALLPDTMLYDEQSARWSLAKDSQPYILAHQLYASDQDVSPPVDGGGRATFHAAPDVMPEASLPAPLTPDSGSMASASDHIATGMSPLYLVALLLGAVWFAASYATHAVQAEGGAFIAGSILGRGVILVLVGALAARYLARRRPAAAWVVVTGLFAVGAVLGYAKAVRFREDLRGSVEAMRMAAASADQIPVESDTLSLRFAVASYTNAANAAWSAYNAVTEETGDGLLAPDVLASSVGRKHARSRLAAMGRGAQALAASLKDAMATMQVRMQVLEEGHSEYRSVAEGFRNSLPRVEKLIGDFVAVELKFVAAADSLIDIVEADPPELSQDGTTLLFNRDLSIVRYNRQFGTLKKLVAEEGAAVAALKEANQRSVHLADSVGSLIQ